MRRFEILLETAQEIAAREGIDWNTPVDESGAVAKEHRWNLASMTGRRERSGNFHFADTAPSDSALAALNAVRQSLGLSLHTRRRPLASWIDFMKICIIDHVFSRNNKPGSTQRMVLCLRILAAEAGDTPPWATSPEIVRRAFNAALTIGASGKTATDLATTVRTMIDDNRLASVPNVARFCVARIPDAASMKELEARQARNRHHSHKAMLERLEDRPSPEKLPDDESYRALKRLIFGAVPKTFSDRIRFGVLKMHLVTGLRIEEVLSAPMWALLWHEYLDSDGVSAAEKGGVARELRFRHFAAKKPTEEDQGAILFETSQEVPLRFQQMVADTVREVLDLTAPARNRLKLQQQSGRLFPEFSPGDLVPASEMFVRLTGNVCFSRAPIPESLIEEYRRTGDLQSLWTIRDLQAGAAVSPTQISYWSRHAALAPRDADGDRVGNGRANWKDCFFRIDEVEAYFGKELRSKGPELGTYRLSGGAEYHTHDMLFLFPSRNLIEGRNDGVLDAENYFAFKRVDYADINIALDGGQPESIFRRYLGDEGRKLRIKTHQNRHLQNTELFRNDVSDAIISKRFNRTSFTQSRVYDNRSLSERFEGLDLDDVVLDPRREPQKRALDAIEAGKLGGPKVQTFFRIRDAEGMNAAVTFLAGAVSGFHATPMGVCTTNFLAEPCSRHLECFDNCGHLTRTDDPREQRVLENLLENLLLAEATILKIPQAKRRLGWQSQLAHVQSHIRAVRQTLATKPGSQVFPVGKNLMSPIPTTTKMTLPRRSSEQ